jgi:putative inorganic carbon (HCO3(-)) transporter
LTFVYLNFIYTLIVLGFIVFWIIRFGISLKTLSPLKYPLGLFCLALFLSIIFSQDKLKSLGEFYNYLVGILFFLIAASLNYENRKRIIQAIIVAGFIISLLAIYQYFFGFKHILNYLAKNGLASSFALDYILGQRVFFPFITPNILGGYLIIIIPLILGIKDKEKDVYFYSLSLILISVTLCLLLTKSLGALLSAFFGIIIYLSLQGNFKTKGVFLLLTILFTIGLIFMLRQVSARTHVLPIFSLSMRLDYWKETIRLIKTSPWVGMGLGNFDLPLCRFAHNSYLQIWAETGILGIISILWLIVAGFKSILGNIKNLSIKNLVAGLITANAVFLIHNFADFTFFLPEVATIWWIIFGLAMPLTDS